jgi:hypothetical protein
MKKLLRLAAVVMLGLGLTTGVASASHSSATIRNSGPDSRNEIRSESRKRVRVNNRARVNVNNNNDQFAQTGNATVRGNTNGEDAHTGDAHNENETDTEIGVEINSDVDAMVGGGNNGGGDATISNTGPRSANIIRSESSTNVDVDNSANIDVDNDSVQTAISGNARVSGNTNGGDATTGDASNTNSTTNSISVSF